MRIIYIYIVICINIIVILSRACGRAGVVRPVVAADVRKWARINRTYVMEPF